MYILLDVGAGCFCGFPANLKRHLRGGVVEEIAVCMLLMLGGVGWVVVVVGGLRECWGAHYGNWDVVLGDWMVEGRGHGCLEVVGALHCGFGV